MPPAIVLAAGASRRMGRSKALLAAGDQTFVGRIVSTLAAAGVSEIVVIARANDRELAAEVERAGARLTVNHHAEDGQLSSLVTGLDTVDAPGVDAVLVTLVDVPLLRPSTVRTLIDRAAASPASIVRAAHNGRHGHPVIFKRDVFAALRAADPAIGAKAVFGAFEVENVEVDDPGIAEDVDTPDDYRRLLTGGPPNP